MNHIDLFSGIGGFAYAAQQVWPDYRNLFFCDNNKFCQAVLRKNFGQDILIYNDIREVTVERFIADTDWNGPQEPGKREQAGGDRQLSEVASDTASKRLRGGGEDRPREQSGLLGTDIENIESGVTSDTERPGQLRTQKYENNGQDSERGWRHDSADTPCHVDLLTGGFPCQPFSVAGKREGRDDDRHLWPEMFRVIKAFSPRWVIAENVRGLINIENGMAFEQVCLDLESIGYTVQAFVIPACAVNAPHRRDRVWIVANITKNPVNRGNGRRDNGDQAGLRRPLQTEGSDRHAADTANYGLHGTENSESDQQGNERNKTGENELCEPKGSDTLRTGITNWNKNWLEVATRLCRVDDGLPVNLDGLKLSKSKHREERLKSLGNAIVPQVAIEIMRTIKNSDLE